MFSPPFSCDFRDLKPISSCQIMKDDGDNSLINITTVDFVLYANAGDGRNTILTLKVDEMAVIWNAAKYLVMKNEKVTSLWYGKKKNTGNIRSTTSGA